MTAAVGPKVRTSGRTLQLIRFVRTVLVGGVLCAFALTSVWAMGWLQGAARRHALSVAGQRDAGPTWVMGARGHGWIVRLFGGLSQNIRRGAWAVIGLALLTLPFTGLWLVSWWAGWENSFNKGYEQSFVGPTVGMLGAGLACVIFVFLPMALAHQSVEDRPFAILELRKVRSAVSHTGIGYIVFTLACVVASFPIFAGRGLIVFVEGIVPGLADYGPQEIDALLFQIAVAKGLYVFSAFTVLRQWSAGIYARAVLQAGTGPDFRLWAQSPLLAGVPEPLAPRRSTSLAAVRWLRMAILAVIWFGIVAQIFVGQFLNHDWHMWLTHPVFLLPWAG